MSTIHQLLPIMDLKYVPREESDLLIAAEISPNDVRAVQNFIDLTTFTVMSLRGLLLTEEANTPPPPKKKTSIKQAREILTKKLNQC